MRLSMNRALLVAVVCTASAFAPAPVPARPASRSAGRRVAQASDEPRTVAATAAPAEEPGGLALELSTSGFASGTLAGGIFLGGRLASGLGGLILGGTFDYALQSVNLSAGGADVTTAAQQFRLGAGARLT